MDTVYDFHCVHCHSEYTYRKYPDWGITCFNCGENVFGVRKRVDTWWDDNCG